jgi:hypothetical protein
MLCSLRGGHGDGPKLNRKLSTQSSFCFGDYSFCDDQIRQNVASCKQMQRRAEWVPYFISKGTVAIGGSFPTLRRNVHPILFQQARMPCRGIGTQKVQGIVGRQPLHPSHKQHRPHLAR